MDCNHRYPWNSPGKNTGVDCHSLLQGIFLIQGLNLDLLHCRQILYCLSYQGCPFFLHEVAMKSLEPHGLEEDLMHKYKQ